MKNTFLFLLMLIIMSAAAAVSAYADNGAVENMLASRPDLSVFYRALITTGVNRELSPDMSYTVLAPTNDAFARVRQDQYPCFYMAQCRAQVAQILRNHIIPGQVYIDESTRKSGALRALSGRYIRVGEPSRNNFAVDGNNLIYMSWFGAGILYKIDGVIINQRELAEFQFLDFEHETRQREAVVSARTIPDPACGPGGCPDAVSETTTITDHAVSPPVVTYGGGDNRRY